jgi:hypothetical protein
LEETFPPGVVKILFGASRQPPGLSGVEMAADWTGVSNYVFHGPE